jgi:bifunctional ADP-heptose synthase (sugar kinase/adenylyltransferase)
MPSLMGLVFMNKTELQQLFDNMDSIHVVVVGDVMLDNYWWGNVERISPEAPVPIVALTGRDSRLGGAANVALPATTAKAAAWCSWPVRQA